MNADPVAAALADASTYSEIGRHREALEVLVEAARIAPEDPRIATALALAHIRAGRSDRALAALDAVSGGADASPEITHLRVAALLRLHRAKEALATARDAQHGHPADSVLRVDHLLAATAAGELSEAETVWSTTAGARSTDLATLRAGTLLALASKRWADAETCARAALLVDRGDIESHANLGIALHQLGKREDARGHLKRAHALSEVTDRHREVAKLRSRAGYGLPWPERARLVGWVAIVPFAPAFYLFRHAVVLVGALAVAAGVVLTANVVATIRADVGGLRAIPEWANVRVPARPLDS